jgi:subtilisin family serine protease
MNRRVHLVILTSLLVAVLVSCGQTTPNVGSTTPSKSVSVRIDTSLQNNLMHASTTPQASEGIGVIQVEDQRLQYDLTQAIVRMTLGNRSQKLKELLIKESLTLLHDGQLPAPPKGIPATELRPVEDLGDRLVQLVSSSAKKTQAELNALSERLARIGVKGAVAFSSDQAADLFDKVLRLREDNPSLVKATSPNWSGTLQTAYPEHQGSGVFSTTDWNPALTDIKVGGGGGAWEHFLPSSGQLIDGTGVQVAIIDTGFEPGNYDLNVYNPLLGVYTNPRFVWGYDFTDYDYEVNVGPSDDCIGSSSPYACMHGTAVAEAAAGARGNQYGSAGTAPRADLMLFRARGCVFWVLWECVSKIVDFYRAGLGVATAVYWGADVINMSFSFYSGIIVCGNELTACTLRDNIRSAVNAGLIVLAGAGNDGNTNVGAPAAFPEVYSVGALNGASRASYSNYGDVDFWASGFGYSTPVPGLGCYAGNRCLGNPYSDFGFNGTSAASPYAAGVAVLLKQLNPSINQAQAGQVLIDSSTPIWDAQAGWMRVIDAKFAVRLAGAWPTGGYWQWCAGESGYCSFSGKQLVKYGTSSAFVRKVFTGGTSCSNAVFGDPAPGYYKQCEILRP